MPEKRSLFKSIFGWVGQKTGITRLQMLNGYTPVFTQFSGNLYDADTVRSCIDAIARNGAKLKPRHVRRVGKDIIPVGGQIEKMLQVRPNPNMSTYDFLYKMITTLLIENNAFAYPIWDGLNLKAIWPVNCSMAEFMEDSTGTIYVKFYFLDGKNIVLPYSEVIHLRRHFYKNDMTGEQNKPINTTLDAINTTNEGIAQAVKMSANIRGIIKYKGMLKDSDVEANRLKFVEQYMTMQNSGGVAAMDDKADYVELKNTPIVINAAQMKELRDNAYRYFGVNENIVMNKYTEEEWDAFNELIECYATQMSLEFTSKIFTNREQGFGNEIIFEANRLYASNKTKVSMLQQMIPMGLLTINEARELFNLAPVEGGEKRLQTLNYVSADKADQYQLGEGDDNNNGKSKKGTSPDGTQGN